MSEIKVGYKIPGSYIHWLSDGTGFKLKDEFWIEYMRQCGHSIEDGGDLGKCTKCGGLMGINVNDSTLQITEFIVFFGKYFNKDSKIVFDTLPTCSKVLMRRALE